MAGSAFDRRPNEWRRLEAIFENALDAILLADGDRRFLDANPAACALLGAPREEILRLSIDSIVVEDQRLHVPTMWASFLSAGRASGELRIECRSGSLLAVEFRAVANITPGVHLSILRDVTERRRLDAGLRAAQDADTVRMLAAGAVHDLNNLLLVITTNSGLALEEELPNNARRCIENILVAAEGAGELARHVVSYVRGARSTLQLTDLTHCVAELTPLIRTCVPRQVDVEYALARVPYIDGVPSQLQQVILNLIINAGQAIVEGGPGIITVQTQCHYLADPRLEPETANLPMGEYVALTIEDSGRGIDEKTQARVFDPFFTTKAHGTGLGLAAAQEIVKSHAGVMWVRSALGRGTCFTVLLPARAEH